MVCKMKGAVKGFKYKKKNQKTMNADISLPFPLSRLASP